MLQLPEARDERLARAPLKLVVAQVRYARPFAALELEVGLAVQEALGGAGQWRLESTQNELVLSLALSQLQGSVPAAVPVEAQPGWRLTAEDRAWTVTVLPQSVSLETTRYKSWAAFWARFSVLLDTVASALRPTGEERLGLRYINSIDDPRVTTPGEWGRWIRREALGLVLHPDFGPSIAATHQQVDLVLAQGTGATLRHGIRREEGEASLAYMIDIDTYRSGVRKFDPADIRSAMEQHNHLARQLFQNVITEDLYVYLRGEA